MLQHNSAPDSVMLKHNLHPFFNGLLEFPAIPLKYQSVTVYENIGHQRTKSTEKQRLVTKAAH